MNTCEVAQLVELLPNLWFTTQKVAGSNPVFAVRCDSQSREATLEKLKVERPKLPCPYEAATAVEGINFHTLTRSELVKIPAYSDDTFTGVGAHVHGAFAATGQSVLGNFYE